MLDPGRYIAQAIYFLLWSAAQGFWEINRSLLSIAVIVESINTWVTDNISYFVEAVVNALEAPMSALFVIALGALGAWYAFNTIVATNKWVDPSKLITYGFVTLFFFSSPIIVIDAMEDIRVSLSAGMQASVLSGASGDIFDTGMSSGTDDTIPPAIPDVNADGVIGSFDLVAYLMSVDNLNQLNNIEFPPDFEATYFPYGDPATIDLSDESDRTEALRLAWDGIKRLFYALMAIPTAIAEHFLRLSLTGAAMILYTGVPFALMLSFFVYTQAFLGAYIRQFINLLIETFLSVIIVGLMVGLMIAAAEVSIGLYIGASIIALIVILWRIKGAFKLATAAFDLFGGGSITGGASGADLRNMATQTAGTAVGLGAAALTGGSALVLAGGLSAMAQQQGTANDPAMQNRIKQLKTVAGYTAGQSRILRRGIETTHEIRTFGRNFYDGGLGDRTPTTLDYLRLGSQMSGMNSSPWMAMGLSPSLRQAYDEIGGRGNRYGRPEVYDEDGANITRELGLNGDNDSSTVSRSNGSTRTERDANGHGPMSRTIGREQDQGQDAGDARRVADGNEEIRQLGSQLRNLEGAITDLTRALIADPAALHDRMAAAYAASSAPPVAPEWESGDQDIGRKRQPTQQRSLLDELEDGRDQEAAVSLATSGSTAGEDRPETTEPQRVVIAGEDKDGDGEMDTAAIGNTNTGQEEQPTVASAGSDGEIIDTIPTADALSKEGETTAGDTTADAGERLPTIEAEPTDTTLSPPNQPSTMISEPGSQPQPIITEPDGRPQTPLTEPGENETALPGQSQTAIADSGRQPLTVGEPGSPMEIDKETLTGAVTGAVTGVVVAGTDQSASPTADQPQRIEIENEEGAPIRAVIDTDTQVNAAANAANDTSPGEPPDIDAISQAVAQVGLPADADVIAPAADVNAGEIANDAMNAIRSTAADQPIEREIANAVGAPIQTEVNAEAIAAAVAGAVGNIPLGQPMDTDAITNAVVAAVNRANPGIPVDTEAIAAAVVGIVGNTPADEVDAGEIADAVASALSSATVNVPVVAGEGTQIVTAGKNDGASATMPQVNFAPPAPPNQGVVIVASGKSSQQVQEVMVNLVGAMDDPNRAVMRQASTGIEEFAGPQAAAAIQQAVAQHGATNIQQSITVTADLVDTLAAQGATGDQILSQFQSGIAADMIRQQTSTAYTDEQIAAVADAVLMPRRVLSKADLAEAIAGTLQQGYTSENALAAQLGTPTNFGGDTGAIRAVMQGAQEMQLDREEIRRMAEQIGQGLKQEVRQQLQQLGHSRLTVEGFVNGLETLPDALQVPQTAAFRPGDFEGYKRYTKKDLTSSRGQ